MRSTHQQDFARHELANRLFFRLYQCANMLHKTGTKAVESEGLTTQQWAVLGALSRPVVPQGKGGGMSIGELARYLLVSRQNLAGLITRMVRNGHIEVQTDACNRRTKLVSLTAAGLRVWAVDAQPKIRTYYKTALDDFSTGDLTHTLHYLLKLLGNMKALDHPK
jgi:DNA-binding MarR family transcriptional regulator